MTCTVHKDSKFIDQVLFFCECDDGRTVLVSGQYYERFCLPEILSRIGAQLANATIEIERSGQRIPSQNGDHETSVG